MVADANLTREQEVPSAWLIYLEGVDAADAKSAVTNLAGKRRVLAGVANNLNQLTAKVHATGELGGALLATLRGVDRLTAHVEAVVDQVTAVVDGRSTKGTRRRSG